MIEQPFGQASAGGDGYRGELHPAGDIANGIDAGLIGILVLVHRDHAVAENADAGRLQVQAGGVGASADGPDDRVETFQVLARTVNDQPLIPFGQATDLEIGVYLDALAGHFLVQDLADHRIEQVEDAVVQGHQGDFGTQRAEHAGQFDADVAAADDRHAVGALRELEEAVRSDAEIGTGQRRNDGLASGGDDDMFGAVDLAIDLDMMTIDKVSATADVVDAEIFNIAVPEAVDHRDVVLAPLDQFFPVDVLETGLHAEIGGVLHRVGQVGRIPHHLLRHATVVDAGAAQAFLLDDADLAAEGGCLLGHGQSAAAAAEDEKIVVLVAVCLHGLLSSEDDSGFPLGSSSKTQWKAPAEAGAIVWIRPRPDPGSGTARVPRSRRCARRR